MHASAKRKQLSITQNTKLLFLERARDKTQRPEDKVMNGIQQKIKAMKQSAKNCQAIPESFKKGGCNGVKDSSKEIFLGSNDWVTNKFEGTVG